MAKAKANSNTIDMPEVDETTLKKGKVSNDYSNLIQGAGGYNPLDEGVIERDYTKPKVAVTGTMPPIQEPSFERPTIEDFDTREVEDMPEETRETQPFDTYDLNDKEKKIACENIVDTFLGAYGLLHEWGYKFVSVSDEDITDYAMNGDIDLSIEYPLSTEKNITFKEFCDSYNDQAKDILSVDEEFVEDVRPRLIRIAMKHDMGMTDEAYCIYKFSVDIAQKGGAIYSFKKQMSLTIEHLATLTKDFKGNNPPSQQPPPSQQQPPPPEPPPQSQEIILTDDEEVVYSGESAIYMDDDEEIEKNTKGKRKTKTQEKDDLLPPNVDEIKEPEEN